MPKLYGLLAEFPEDKSLLLAAEKLGKAGYRHVESYSPFEVVGMAEALHFRPTAVAMLFLIAALIGGAAGFYMQYDASVLSYPENVGGRPFNSWPSFIPITFEMSILGGVLVGVFSMIWLNGLPRYSHPVSNVERFRAASTSAFFICVEASDPKFQIERTAGLLKELGATQVTEVPT